MMNSTPAQPLPTPRPPRSCLRTALRWFLLFILLDILAIGVWWGVSFVSHSLTVHPQGKIVFECGNSLCLANADGSEYKQLTDKAIDSNPSWSPDGKQIVFTRKISSGTAYPYPTVLFVMNVDGTSIQQLSDPSNIYAGSPVWSPDGNHIALNYLKKEDNTQGIAVVNVDGTGFKMLTTTGEEPRWSPDGTHISYTVYADTLKRTGARIYTMNIDGTNQTPLIDKYSESPDWLPDGTQVVLTIYLAPDTYERRIYLLDINTMKETQLTNEYSAAPIWSPDGKKLLFIVL